LFFYRRLITLRFSLLLLFLALLSPLPALAQTATFYGPGFAGKRMANGRAYNPNHAVAAHPSYPIGTRLKVTNRRNGRSVVVTVTDRCSCSLDLSKSAFRRIGNPSQGRIPVSVTRL
jgi:rare lipoprotein A